MVFIFGGAYSGKENYAREKLGITAVAPHDADMETMKTAQAVRDIHLYIKDVMRAGGDPMEAVFAIVDANPDVTLISDEIGYGIVPLDKFEREYREVTGRVSCELVRRAKRVIRVVCGIGVELNSGSEEKQ